MLNSLRRIWIVVLEGLTLLRRDKIFIPALVMGAAIAIVANLASDWSVEDFRKILFDIGAFGFRVTGGIVALLWGTKLITDSRSDGSLEVKLAAPVSRAGWILGRYVGLLLALAMLGAFLMIVWQLLMLGNNFGVMNKGHVQLFAFLALEWAVVASVAVCFATFCRNAVALFSTLCLWITGLLIPTLAVAVSPETPEFTRQVIEWTSLLWNLSQFNLVDQAIAGIMPSLNALMWLGAYGVARIAFFLSLGAVIFARRDLTY